MAIFDEIESEVNAIIRQPWNIRDGYVVPTTESIALAGGAVKINATMLYADLADSTELAMHDRQLAAKVYKAFLAISTRLIKANGGEIRSFDGDRVMGVFMSDSKNTQAAKCGLQINYIFGQVIIPKFKNSFVSIRNGAIVLKHCVGIDTSEILVVRGGIRNNNDLLWIGRSPNIAAKLSALRVSNNFTFITDVVYNSLQESSKLATGVDMWCNYTWHAFPTIPIFGSTYHWKP